MAISLWLQRNFFSAILLELPLMHLKSRVTVFDTKGPIINYLVSLLLNIHSHLFVGLLDFFRCPLSLLRNASTYCRMVSIVQAYLDMNISVRLATKSCR